MLASDAGCAAACSEAGSATVSCVETTTFSYSVAVDSAFAAKVVAVAKAKVEASKICVNFMVWHPYLKFFMSSRECSAQALSKKTYCG